MALTHLNVRDFRCFEAIDEVLELRHNLIVGPNASGKTSFLESIYFLGRGRSFRVAQSQRLVRQNAVEFTVSGHVSDQVSDENIRSTPLGVRFRPREVLIKVDGQRCTGFASLAERLPVQVIHPDVHQLVEGGPGYRRRFMDWGVFHVKQNFLADWREFNRALKQRNSCLRQNLSKNQLDTWSEVLLAAGGRVSAARAAYSDQLAPFVAETSKVLLGETLEIHYKPGWREELTFPEALDASWRRDRELRTTQVGPQRGDLGLLLDGLGIQGRVSRGQQKLLAATLILAQVQLLESLRPQNSVLLLDDPAAELDNHSLERFLDIAGELRTQLFVTALRETDLPHSWRTGRVFHVKQGQVTDVVQ